MSSSRAQSIIRSKLKALLLREFAPYGEDRLDARGPEIEIEPNTARNLILFIDELVTNAVKYGSLSRETGRVLVDWRIDGCAVVLHWRERRTEGEIAEQARLRKPARRQIYQGAFCNPPVTIFGRGI